MRLIGRGLPQVIQRFPLFEGSRDLASPIQIDTPRLWGTVVFRVDVDSTNSALLSVRIVDARGTQITSLPQGFPWTWTNYTGMPYQYISSSTSHISLVLPPGFSISGVDLRNFNSVSTLKHLDLEVNMQVKVIPPPTS